MVWENDIHKEFREQEGMLLRYIIASNIYVKTHNYRYKGLNKENKIRFKINNIHDLMILITRVI